MEIFTNAVPVWVSILFLLAIPIPVFMIAKVAKEGALKTGLPASKIQKVIVLFYGIYFLLVSLISFTGIFLENTLPPKVVLFTTLPLLLFLMLVVFNTKAYKSIVQGTTLQAIVQLHLFRLIGVFFLITHAYGAIPAKFAYMAGLGDIATAVTSIFVAKAIIKNKLYAKKLTIAWNIFGLADILNVLATAILTTKLSINTGSQGVVEIANFPFVLIPAFAPATIIFLHITIFKKLKLISNENQQP